MLFSVKGKRLANVILITVRIKMKLSLKGTLIEYVTIFHCMFFSVKGKRLANIVLVTVRITMKLSDI